MSISPRFSVPISNAISESITAPNGQITTTLTIDENNNLTQVAYEDNSKYEFSYFDGSLMDIMTDPNGNVIQNKGDRLLLIHLLLYFSKRNKGDIMPGIPRGETARGIYYIINRGNMRMQVFDDMDDYECFFRVADKQG